MYTVLSISPSRLHGIWSFTLSVTDCDSMNGNMVAPAGSGTRHTCCVHGCTMTGQHQCRHKVERRFIANHGRPWALQKRSARTRVDNVAVVRTSQTSSPSAARAASACKCVPEPCHNFCSIYIPGGPVHLPET